MIEIATSMCASSQKITLEHVQSTHLMALLPTSTPLSLSFGFQHPNGGLQLENVQNVVCVCVACSLLLLFSFLPVSYF